MDSAAAAGVRGQPVDGLTLRVRPCRRPPTAWPALRASDEADVYRSHPEWLQSGHSCGDQCAVLEGRACVAPKQASEAAQVLAEDTGLSDHRTINVPNSPMGRAEKQRSNYLRDRFDIPHDTKIILSSGTLGAWACIHQIMRSTQHWPENWVLVCHTRYRADNMNRDYLEALRYLAKPGKVVFSTDPIPRDEYPKLVQSADVGIAFYCVQQGNLTAQDNIRFLGLSSGKLAYYLQAGVPVIANRIPSIEKLLSEYRCGEITEDPSITHFSLEKIFSDYKSYSSNAIKCFNAELEFESRFRKVVSAVEAL